MVYRRQAIRSGKQNRDSSQTRGDTTILRPNGDHFGQLERRAPGGPFLNVLLKLDFIRGMTDFCDQPKNFFFNVSSANNTQQAQSLDVRE